MSSRPASRAMLLTVAFAAALTTACGGDDPIRPTDGHASFLVEVSGEQFRVRVADTTQVRLLEERLAAGVAGVVSGTLRAGDGGFNAPWSWHLDPETVHAADLSIEVCDGRPSMVEGDLDYWLGTVKQFCPWGAKLVAKE